MELIVSLKRDDIKLTTFGRNVHIDAGLIKIHLSPGGALELYKDLQEILTSKEYIGSFEPGPQQ